jgi:hypothetical protein
LEDGTRFVVEERPVTQYIPSPYIQVRVVGPEPTANRTSLPLYRIDLPGLAMRKLAIEFPDTTPARLAALRDIVSGDKRARAVMLQKVYEQRPEIPGAIMNHIEGYAGQANPPHFFGGSATQPAYENPGAATGGGSSSTSMNALNRRRKTRRASRRSNRKRNTRQRKN